MAPIAAAVVLLLTLIACGLIGFANGMSNPGGRKVSPWPILIGGSLVALIVALSHGLPW